MTFDAVTTFAPKHWETHAARCVLSFQEFWDIPLRVYRDADLDGWLPAFKERHKHLPTDNYRKDAVRFAHKVAAIEKAFYVGIADVMIWMDADCVTHAPVEQEWLESLIGDADFGYLRRSKKYPECGFMMIRRNPQGAALVNGVVDLYTSDALFGLREWHDSYAIEHVRSSLSIKCASLSGDAEGTGHPLVNGPLGTRLDHLKGTRKAEGRSRSSDLVRPRTEAWWRSVTVN